MIDGPNSFRVSTRTCSTGPFRVAVGQHITVGTEIGQVGSTGSSTGAHLHLEIHVNGTPVDPFVLAQGPRQLARHPPAHPGIPRERRKTQQHEADSRPFDGPNGC